MKLTPIKSLLLLIITSICLNTAKASVMTSSGISSGSSALTISSPTIPIASGSLIPISTGLALTPIILGNIVIASMSYNPVTSVSSSTSISALAPTIIALTGGLLSVFNSLVGVLSSVGSILYPSVIILPTISSTITSAHLVVSDLSLSCLSSFIISMPFISSIGIPLSLSTTASSLIVSVVNIISGGISSLTLTSSLGLSIIPTSSSTVSIISPFSAVLTPLGLSSTLISSVGITPISYMLAVLPSISLLPSSYTSGILSVYSSLSPSLSVSLTGISSTSIPLLTLSLPLSEISSIPTSTLLSFAQSGSIATPYILGSTLSSVGVSIDSLILTSNTLVSMGVTGVGLLSSITPMSLIASITTLGYIPINAVSSISSLPSITSTGAITASSSSVVGVPVISLVTMPFASIAGIGGVVLGRLTGGAKPALKYNEILTPQQTSETQQEVNKITQGLN